MFLLSCLSLAKLKFEIRVQNKDKQAHSFKIQRPSKFCLLGAQRTKTITHTHTHTSTGKCQEFTQELGCNLGQKKENLVEEMKRI